MRLSEQTNIRSCVVLCLRGQQRNPFYTHEKKIIVLDPQFKWLDKSPSVLKNS